MRGGRSRAWKGARRCDISELAWTLTAIGAAPFLGKAAAIASLALPAGRPLTWRETACATCGAGGGWVMALPLVGVWAASGCCDKPARGRFLLLEAIATAVAIWACLLTPGPAAVIATLLGSWLMLLAVLDVEHRWLPLKLTVPLVALGLALAALVWPADIAHRLIGAGAGYGAFALLALGFRAVAGKVGLGGGDAWLAAAAGAWVGWQGLPIVVLIAALGALSAALALWVSRGRKAALAPAPFGAWLAGSLWLVWVYGL